MIPDLLAAVRALHLRTAEPSGSVVVIDEPYAPFVPPRWNGMLVVAEAQNLAGDTPYVRRLHAASPEERISRLYWDPPHGLGIGPWDDGTLKLAVTAAWPDRNHEEFAVGNAVPWSQVTDVRNVNPEPTLHERSVEFWKAIAAVMQPALVITVGKIARDVIARAMTAVPTVRLAPASPVYLNRVAWLFDCADLLSRFPTVSKAELANPAWVQTHREAKVFFACHAVSNVSGRPAAGVPRSASTPSVRGSG